MTSTKSTKFNKKRSSGLAGLPKYRKRKDNSGKRKKLKGKNKKLERRLKPKRTPNKETKQINKLQLMPSPSKERELIATKRK